MGRVSLAPPDVIDCACVSRVHRFNRVFKQPAVMVLGAMSSIFRSCRAQECAAILEVRRPRPQTGALTAGAKHNGISSVARQHLGANRPALAVDDDGQDHLLQIGAMVLSRTYIPCVVRVLDREIKQYPSNVPLRYWTRCENRPSALYLHCEK